MHLGAQIIWCQKKGRENNMVVFIGSGSTLFDNLLLLLINHLQNCLVGRRKDDQGGRSRKVKLLG